MFTTNSQLALFCEAICNVVGLEGIFTGANGGEVTQKGLKLWKRNGMSHGEQLMFRLAKDVWNGDGGCPVSEMVSTLDGSNLRVVAEVFLALADNSRGRGADAFIEKHLRRAAPPFDDREMNGWTR